MRTRFNLYIALLLATGSLYASAQSNSVTSEAKTDKHFYRLDFRLEEVDGNGKITNTRTYSAITGTYDKSPTHTIRTGDRIPVSSGANQFQYIDTGVNIDFEDPYEQGSALIIPVSAQISSVAALEPGSATLSAVREASEGPVIRQNTWKALVKVPLRKATVIFASDNLNNRGKTQLELTATPVE
jgi:hypothetical protein